MQWYSKELKLKILRKLEAPYFFIPIAKSEIIKGCQIFLWQPFYIITYKSWKLA
ncbi:hypothetical protein CSW65_03335 [Streptococcus agalactiae]|nr:hypothetical protein B8U92_00520 [Streptococcus agalactiae]OTG46717.1 hypothetical protein B7934_07505 [Streptococcus agalactiae]PHU33138.1 hypothetical protein CSW65_03335 [Streptococcus agalactiae]PWT21291.1 hypothetical protein CUZ34_08215 [Streptococcus agalactiae]QHO93861.1 hypothetical protein C2E46_08675 [Streptococcus agalactiae]